MFRWPWPRKTLCALPVNCQKTVVQMIFPDPRFSRRSPPETGRACRDERPRCCLRKVTSLLQVNILRRNPATHSRTTPVAAALLPFPCRRKETPPLHYCRLLDKGGEGYSQGNTSNETSLVAESLVCSLAKKSGQDVTFCHSRVGASGSLRRHSGLHSRVQRCVFSPSVNGLSQLPSLLSASDASSFGSRLCVRTVFGLRFHETKLLLGSTSSGVWSSCW